MSRLCGRWIYAELNCQIKIVAWTSFWRCSYFWHCVISVQGNHSGECFWWVLTKKKSQTNTRPMLHHFALHYIPIRLMWTLWSGLHMRIIVFYIIYLYQECGSIKNWQSVILTASIVPLWRWYLLNMKCIVIDSGVVSICEQTFWCVPKSSLIIIFFTFVWVFFHSAFLECSISVYTVSCNIFAVAVFCCSHGIAGILV